MPSGAIMNARKFVLIMTKIFHIPTDHHMTTEETLDNFHIIWDKAGKDILNSMQTYFIIGGDPIDGDDTLWRRVKLWFMRKLYG